MMVVGLFSGKELLVQDKSFFITEGKVNPVLKQVFISPDAKRRYTVQESQIEFYDEVNSEEYMNTIQQNIETTLQEVKDQEVGVDYV